MPARKRGARESTTPRRRGRPPAGTTAILPDDLLDTALETFAEFGYEGTSVRDLCRRLGVSHNLVHQRYGSKEELWYAAVDHGFEALTYEMMQAVVDVGDGNDIDRLRAVLVRFVEVTAASPSLMRVINQEGVSTGPRLDHIYARHVGPAMQLVGDMLDRLSADGRVRPVPVGVFYFLMANGATGALTLPALASHFPDVPKSKRKADLRTYAESVVDLLFDGIVIDGAPS